MRLAIRIGMGESWGETYRKLAFSWWAGKKEKKVYGEKGEDGGYGEMLGLAGMGSEIVGRADCLVWVRIGVAGGVGSIRAFVLAVGRRRRRAGRVSGVEE